MYICALWEQEELFVFSSRQHKATNPACFALELLLQRQSQVGFLGPVLVMIESVPVSSVISASYIDMGKFVFADLPDLLMAALSKACAASSSVSWSPRDTVRL